MAGQDYDSVGVYFEGEKTYVLGSIFDYVTITRHERDYIGLDFRALNPDTRVPDGWNWGVFSKALYAEDSWGEGEHRDLNHNYWVTYKLRYRIECRER